MKSLSQDDLRRCEELKSYEDLRALLDEIRSMCEGLTPEEALGSLAGEADDAERATALLFCAAHGWRPAREALARACGQESAPVTAAAALCAVLCFAGEGDFLRGLLFGPDSHTPSGASRNGRSFLIKTMGLSGDSGCLEVLGEALRKHFHYCRMGACAEAIERLNGTFDEQREGVYFSRSISVLEASGGISIHTDERYSGGSNCVDCKFFGCRINRYYPGGIEDCKLWNRVDPDSLGEIVDRRDWGTHLESETGEPPALEALLSEARELLEFEQAVDAIAPLCELLLAAELDNPLQTAAWINLARGFEACGEPALAYVALREGSRTGNLVRTSEATEREQLERFIDDPERALGRPFGRPGRQELRALGYKQSGLPARALDLYVDVNIGQRGASAGNWFEMGECHCDLGEFQLAELFMLKAALLTRNPSLRERFAGAEAAVRTYRASTARTPALNLEQRAADRAAADPPNLCTLD